MTPRKFPRLILAATAIVASSCQHPIPPPADPPQVKSLRVSDRYSRAAVASYDVFKGDIDQHCLAIIRLTSGERFPMVCRLVEGGVYPIPQSVFSSGENATEWDLMCEPRIDQSYALISLSASFESGVFKVGRKILSPLTPKPKLLP